MAGYPISTVVEVTGLSARQIRYYEQLGLVKPERTSGNHRRFTESDISVLQEIARLKNQGYSLQQIRSMLLGTRQEDPWEKYNDARQYFKR